MCSFRDLSLNMHPTLLYGCKRPSSLGWMFIYLSCSAFQQVHILGTADLIMCSSVRTSHWHFLRWQIYTWQPGGKLCRILILLAKNKKAMKLPPLNKHHKENYICWTKKYMKTHFTTVWMNLMVGLEVWSFKEIVKQHDLKDNRWSFGTNLLDNKTIGSLEFQRY